MIAVCRTEKDTKEDSSSVKRGKYDIIEAKKGGGKTMSKIKIYLETTVVSDLTSRPSPLLKNLARQISTKEWYDEACANCDFCVSQLVDIESARGDVSAAQRRAEFLSGIQHLQYGVEAINLAKKFLEAAAIPMTSFDDATHVAIATIAKVDAIATWNCKHINNPQTMPKIVKVCEQNGYTCPLIGTPDQLKEVYNG